MKLLTSNQLNEIVEIIRQSSNANPNEVFDVYARQYKPQSYYATNTRGVIVTPPAFTHESIHDDSKLPRLHRSIQEATLLDNLVVAYTSTPKWLNEPNITVAKLGLHLVWLFQDECSDLANEYDISRMLVNSASYIRDLTATINDVPDPYVPRPWTGI